MSAQVRQGAAFTALCSGGVAPSEGGQGVRARHSDPSHSITQNASAGDSSEQSQTAGLVRRAAIGPELPLTVYSRSNMARYRTLTTLCLLCLMECVLISAFNLDTENVIRKTGEKDSLFGFSLALHRQLNPSDKRM